MDYKPDFDTRDREGHDDFDGTLDYNERAASHPEEFEQDDIRDYTDEADREHERRAEVGLPERDMDGGYFHEIVDDEEFMIQCLECGFIGETCDADGECPNCGSTDTELA